MVFPFLEVLEDQLSLLEPLAKDSSRDNTGKTFKAPEVQSRWKAGDLTQNLYHLSTSFQGSPRNPQGEPWEEAGLIIMFPISGQWKEEVAQAYLHRAHYKFLAEVGTLLYSLILYKFPTESCPNLSGNQHRFMRNCYSDIFPVLLLWLCAFRERLEPL